MDLGGGENEFFAVSFFGTCIEDTMMLRKMTEFKNEFKTLWKKLFFPINVYSNHWILLTIDIDEKAVEVFGSLGQKNEHFTKALLKVINQLKKKDEQWVVLDNSTANIQRQHDSVCCGWFTCWYAYQIATNKSMAK
jgi:Ulp1 family protease